MKYIFSRISGMSGISRALVLVFVGLVSLPNYAQDFDDEEESAAPAKRHVIKQDTNVKLTEVKGTVIDKATGQPLAGVQIKSYGDSRYTAMTDEKGEFIIKVPDYTTSLFAFVPDYLSQQVPVKSAKKISMLSSKFGTMYQEETEIASRKDFVSNHTTGVTIENEISQKLGADVRTITRNAAPGNGATMFIRGLGSINSDAQPLVVLDGIEMDMQRSRTALHSGQFLDILASISPDDIEKVEVLKNATAIYGARGANGVINITTKRGHSMATRIDANISVGFTTIPSLQKMMNAQQFRTYAVEMIGTMPDASVQGQYKFLNDDPNGYYYYTYHNDTDWSKSIYRQALQQNYSINVQGGDDIGMYNLSVGYNDAQSTIKESGMSRMNIRFNSDISILWNLKTKFDASISRTTTNVFDDGVPSDFTQATPTSLSFLAAAKSPLLSPYQYNKIINGFSSLLSEADDLFEQLGSGYSLANPEAILVNGSGNNKNRAENTYFNAKLLPVYEINSDMKISAIFSYTLDRMSQRYYRPYGGVPEFEIPELGTVTSKVGSLFSKEINILGGAKFSYEHRFGAHDVKAYAGAKYNYFSYDDNNLSTQYSGETSDKNPALALSGFYVSDGNEDKWKNMQMFASADYNYKEKYYASVSLTAEANSRFGEKASGLGLFGVKWALFPSLQAGWVMSNEKWFNAPLVNYLRLNAGFDISGNDNVSNYAARTSLSSIVYNYNAIGLKLTNIGNDKIQWESTKKLNFGLNAALFNNRVSLGFDYYIHNTDNLLTLKTFDNPISGINQYWTNGGSLKNHGFELTVSGKPVATKNWYAEIGASLGHYKNKVKSLPSGDYTSSIYGTDNILTAVGQPVGMFYGYQTKGVFSTEAEASTASAQGGYLTMKDDAGKYHNFQAGDVHFVDQNNDGVIDDNDKVIIGNPNPNLYGNIFVTAGWKNLSLFVGFNYCLGNDVYNYQRSILNSCSSLYNQQIQSISHWRYEGQVTDIPRLNYGDPMGNNRMSDRWIEDGSYLRLKTLRLSYQVPVPVTWSWLQGLGIWAEINNLFTLTKYTGNDPEFSAGNNVLYQGIDAGNLPQSRTFTMGVKINL